MYVNSTVKLTQLIHFFSPHQYIVELCRGEELERPDFILSRLDKIKVSVCFISLLKASAALSWSWINRVNSFEGHKLRRGGNSSELSWADPDSAQGS